MVYVQVDDMKHSQRESLAVLTRNNIEEITLPSSICMADEQRKFLIIQIKGQRAYHSVHTVTSFQMASYTCSLVGMKTFK